jgi:hypothetical protein
MENTRELEWSFHKDGNAWECYEIGGVVFQVKGTPATEDEVGHFTLSFSLPGSSARFTEATIFNTEDAAKAHAKHVQIILDTVVTNRTAYLKIQHRPKDKDPYLFAGEFSSVKEMQKAVKAKRNALLKESQEYETD